MSGWNIFTICQNVLANFVIEFLLHDSFIFQLRYFWLKKTHNVNIIVSVALREALSCISHAVAIYYQCKFLYFFLTLDKVSLFYNAMYKVFFFKVFSPI